MDRDHNDSSCRTGGRGRLKEGGDVATIVPVAQDETDL